MPDRGCCITFVPISVFSETTSFILPLKEITVFYLRNAVCGRMVLLVESLGSVLMPKFVLLMKNKIN
jgi:hypothetical protein